MPILLSYRVNNVLFLLFYEIYFRFWGKILNYLKEGHIDQSYCPWKQIFNMKVSLGKGLIITYFVQEGFDVLTYLVMRDFLVDI